MNKQEFLTAIRTTRAELDALLARVESETVPPSIRDLVAHITWYEKEMVAVLESRALIGSPWWDLPTAERNAKIQAEHASDSWERVQAEYHQVFERLLPLLELLEKADLHDPSRFREMPSEWVPWQVIASNTFEHYAEHMAELRALVEREGNGKTNL